MSVYEALKVGDLVSQPGEPHVGKLLELRLAKSPAYDDGDEAYVRWHKGYAIWIKVHNLIRAKT